jgi:iron complex outermembrane receptor protein
MSATGDVMTKSKGISMHLTLKQRVSWILGTVLLVPAVGAASTDSTSSSNSSDELESIIVVGQKENQGLQRAPEAITAISADSLRENGVKSAEDLGSMVPSLVIGESDGYNFDLSIRGIGLNSPQDDGSPASVSVHQNGIFMPNPVSLSLSYLDVDHIEVLRGPQGTVFGQNAVGGTVNIITAQPTFDGVRGYTDVEFGSFDLMHLRTAINLPFSNTFAVRLAGDFDKQDGYVVATLVPGDFHLNDTHNYHVRMTALFQPNDDFSIVGSVEYAKVVQHEPESKNILDPNPNPYDESSDWPGLYNIDQTISTLIATYNFDAMTFKSLSSVQYVNQGGSNSESGLDLDLATQLYGGENDQFVLHQNYAVTQEFDLSSKPGGPFDWVAGAFYLDTRTTDGYDQYLRNPQQPGAPDILNNEVESLVAPEIAAGTLYFETSNSFRHTSVSGFGQGIYHFTDNLRGTAGFRYTEDRNTTLLDNYFGDPDLGGGIVHLSQRSDKVTWKTGLDYQATPDNFLYGSISTGYKPGGGNPGTAPAVVPANYQPETITAYELGSKNQFFDKTFIANFAAFYYVDKNMQYHAEDLINFDGGVDNLPKVNVYGLEGEFTALLPYHFRIDGNLTAEKGKIATHVSTLDNLAGNAANAQFAAEYGETAFLDAEFGVPNPALPNGIQLLSALRAQGYRDVYGNAPPNLPEYTAALALSQTSQFPDGSSLMSRLQGNYRDHYADTVFGNSFYYTTPSYVMMNLFFDYTFSDRQLDLTFAVTNLADRAEVSYRFTNQYGGETTQSWFPPREFIIGLGYKF